MVGDILQPTHLLFVLVVALLVLGPKRLPEVGRSLGRTMRDFRAAISGDDSHETAIPEATPPMTEPVPTTPPMPPSTERTAEAPTAVTGPEPHAEAAATPAEPAEHDSAKAERQPTATR